MIEKINISHLRGNELLQFLKDVVARGSRFDTETLKLAAVFNALNKEIKNLEGTYGNQQGSDITKILEQIDANRDNDLIGIKTVCEGFAYSRDEEISGAANLILKSINNHGTQLNRLNYHAETSVIDTITDDWKEEKCQNALKKIHLLEWSVILGKENDSFKENFQERIDDKMESESESFTELRKPAVKAYGTLCDELFAHSVLSKNQEYTDLAKAINIIVEEYNILLERRKGNNGETIDEQ